MIGPPGSFVLARFVLMGEGCLTVVRSRPAALRK
jgi:hypothetical protein